MTRRGFPNATLRLDPELWRTFGAAATDRSAVLREFIRWYVREPGAKMPRRPGPSRPVPRGPWEPIDRTDEGDQGGDRSPSTP